MKKDYLNSAEALEKYNAELKKNVDLKNIATQAKVSSFNMPSGLGKTDMLAEGKKALDMLPSEKEINMNLPTNNAVQFSMVIDGLNERMAENRRIAQFLGGTYGYTEEKVAALQEALTRASKLDVVTPEQLKLIEQWQQEFIALQAETINFGSVLSSISSGIGSMSSAISTLTSFMSEGFQKAADRLVKFLRLMSQTVAMIKNITAVVSFFQNLSKLDSLAYAKNTKETIANTVAKTSNVAATSAETAALFANTIALAANTAAKTMATMMKGLSITSSVLPFPFNLLGGILGDVGMADGGIVPSGYPNDTFPARLSTNEAVIPLNRIDQFFSKGDKEQKVVFHIDGRQLVGVLEKEDTINNAF
jgi:hypothetical protein